MKISEMNKLQTPEREAEIPVAVNGSTLSLTVGQIADMARPPVLSFSGVESVDPADILFGDTQMLGTVVYDTESSRLLYKVGLSSVYYYTVWPTRSLYHDSGGNIRTDCLFVAEGLAYHYDGTRMLPLGQSLDEVWTALSAKADQTYAEGIRDALAQVAMQNMEGHSRMNSRISALEENIPDQSQLDAIQQKAENAYDMAVPMTLSYGTVGIDELDTISTLDDTTGRFLRVQGHEGMYTDGWLMYFMCQSNASQVLYTHCRIDEGGRLVTSTHDEQGFHVYARHRSKAAGAAWSPWKVAGGDDVIAVIEELRNSQMSLEESQDSDLCIADESGNILSEFSDGHIKTKNFDSRDVPTQEDIENAVPIILAESESDLDIKDENDYVLAQLADGHIRTKNFDSREAVTLDDVEAAMPIATQETEDADVQIADEQGNVVMKIAGGHIRTKNFDSAAIDVEQDVAVVGTESDFEVADESGNVVMRVDGGHIKTRFFDSAEAATGASNRLRILCIGNSYTANSISYMPYILQEVMPSLDLDLTIAFYSGATLAMHRKALEGGERPYNIYRYTSAAGRWSTTTGVGWSDFVNLAEWDVINLLHWNEGVWRDADTALASNKAVQPHLDVLVQHLWAVARRPFKLGWFVVHSLPAGVGSYSGDEAHFRRIAEISRQVMETTAVQYVLPVGTAIQNLRAAGVNVGNKLTSDAIHLADGIAPLCAAYASTEAVLALVAPQRSVLGSKWVPTDDFLAAQGIPGRTGSVLGISDANVLTAQRCAICAVKNPYGVTDFGEEL